MIIDGTKIAAEIIASLRLRISNIGFRPLFCDIIVGDNMVQRSYVAIKGRAAEGIGIQFSAESYPANVDTDTLIDKIKFLNALPNIAGLIVQLPLPASINTARVLAAINPAIDVDCIGKINLDLFYEGQGLFLPPTAAAVMRILDGLGGDFWSGTFLVVGQGPLVGKPLTYSLRQRGLRVMVADKYTQNLHLLLQEADVIISATGRSGLITGSMIKPGSIIVDAGTSETNGGIRGDVDFDSVSGVAFWVSPVPGGVGPVTVAQLLSNVVSVAERM